MEKQREDEIWCLIAGMVSSGKSRFLNALFPGLSLPVGTLPMTAAPTFLRFGREAVEVTTDQGRTIRERVESLEKYSRKWDSPDTLPAPEASPREYSTFGCIFAESPPSRG